MMDVELLRRIPIHRPDPYLELALIEARGERLSPRRRLLPAIMAGTRAAWTRLAMVASKALEHPGVGT